MTLRERIERKEKLCGTIISLTDPAIGEIFGNAGYDFLWIDMEHTYMSYRDVLCHMNAARSAGTAAVVRVPQNDLTATKKVVDMGPDGIIFPMVRSAAEVNELIAMTLYPPRGTRGFGPMRAIGYGKTDAKEYTDEKSLEMCRFVQIEHIDCVDNLGEILKNPYIDGFIFGPNDLSGSLGEICNVTSPRVTEQIRRAIGILRSAGKYVGAAVGHSPETVRYWSKFDLDLLTTGADWNYLYDLACQNLANLHRYHLGKGAEHLSLSPLADPTVGGLLQAAKERFDAVSLRVPHECAISLGLCCANCGRLTPAVEPARLYRDKEVEDYICETCYDWCRSTPPASTSSLKLKRVLSDALPVAALALPLSDLGITAGCELILTREDGTSLPLFLCE